MPYQPWRQRIDRFIPENTPLGRGDEVSMLLRATGGSPLGAAVLAALARKESSFGAAGRLPRFNNYWGYGIHASPSVYSAPNVEKMASRVWKALISPTGYYKKARTLGEIIPIYAPPSENNTGLYQNQVNSWFREMGFNPSTNFRTGARVPVGPGMNQAGPGRQMQSMGSANFAPPPSVALDWNALNSIFKANQADILAGRQPNPKRLQSLLSIVNAGIPTANPQTQPVIGTGNPLTGGPVRTAQSSQFSGLYGFPTGGVDSSRAMAGGAGGNWGGAMPRALALASAVGGPKQFSWMSQKRSRKHTSSGGISDHWVGSTNSYATDLGTSGAKGDALFRKVMQYLAQISGKPSIASTKSGSWHNFTIGGYRYQVGWRVPEHYDHVHVGVKKV